MERDKAEVEPSLIHQNAGIVGKISGDTWRGSTRLPPVTNLCRLKHGAYSRGLTSWQIHPFNKNKQPPRLRVRWGHT